MDQTVTIREASAPQDVAVFWERLHRYHARDIFPDPGDPDRAYFLGPEYQARITALHDRPKDRCRYLFFVREGRDIGFALTAIYRSEDGKCFLPEFCVFPEFRGGGTGTACAKALLRWARTRGARYFELNYGRDPRRLRFWERLGFRPNGADEWGEPLLLLPPETLLPLTAGPLTEADRGQLLRLENGFRAAVGEEPLDEAAQARLLEAVRTGCITFFLARRGVRAVGLCSVARVYSTFACGDTAVFEDFFVEPMSRRAGAARLLARTARDWCRAQGVTSLTVTCAPCDEAMYRRLGFDTPLGGTLAAQL